MCISIYIYIYIYVCFLAEPGAEEVGLLLLLMIIIVISSTSSIIMMMINIIISCSSSSKSPGAPLARLRPQRRRFEDVHPLSGRQEAAEGLLPT